MPLRSNDSFYFLIEAYAVGEESAVEPNPSFGRMDNLESPIQKATKCDHKQRRLSNELTLSNCLKQWLLLTLFECYLLQGFCAEFVGELQPQRREFIVVERNCIIAYHWAPSSSASRVSPNACSRLRMGQVASVSDADFRAPLSATVTKKSDTGRTCPIGSWTSACAWTASAAAARTD